MLHEHGLALPLEDPGYRSPEAGLFSAFLGIAIFHPFSAFIRQIFAQPLQCARHSTLLPASSEFTSKWMVPTRQPPGQRQAAAAEHGQRQGQKGPQVSSHFRGWWGPPEVPQLVPRFRDFQSSAWTTLNTVSLGVQTRSPFHPGVL